MIKNFRGFFKSETGAVTVDWVVLTAAVVALAAGVATVLLDTKDGGIMTTLKEKITDTVSGIGTEDGEG